MPEISLTTLVLLCAAALLAGWIDAVVGGGGLVMLPALLLGLPHLHHTYVLGTNKALAIVGTSGAAVTYVRKAPVNVATAVKVGLAALAGSTAGAFFAAGINEAVLRPLIMVVLVGVAAFVMLKPSFGTRTEEQRRTLTRARVVAAVLLVGGGIGFYDGMFGPGTGTFLVLGLTAVLHLDLVTASATAKIVNVCTNAGALAMFAYQGTVLWQLAAILAAFNLAGAMIGARMALSKGAEFVRGVLLCVVFSLVAKLAFDQWG